MNLTAFFALQFKRVLKNKPFLLLLLFFPICLILLSQAFHSEKDSRIPVGICLSAEDALTETLCEKLLIMEDSLFVFSAVETEEELIRSVQNNRLECGYLFQKPLGKELDKSHLKNLITVYVSESTTCTGVLNELVYANLFEEYALSLLQNTLKEAGHLPFSNEEHAVIDLPSVTKEEIEQFYRTHLADGSTFRIEVQFLSGPDTVQPSGTTSVALPLLRGFTAVFMLLCGFLALLTVHHDKKNGLYARLYGTTRITCPCITMLTHLLPAGLSCLLGLGCSGSITHWGTELLALLCYLFTIILFYLILGGCIRNHTVLCAAFPMVLLCTLAFTPVLVDLSAFFPWIKAVRYVFPTYYYLLFF